MKRLVMLTVVLAATTGCIYVDDRGNGGGGGGQVNPGGGPITVNHPPVITEAASWCSYDKVDRDDVIAFEATVSDADGPLDVVSAWADVYDEHSGDKIDSFEVYPTDDPTYWYSDWLASTTGVDCWYPGYVVDITVYDSVDAYDVMSVYPDTYR